MNALYLSVKGTGDVKISLPKSVNLENYVISVLDMKGTYTLSLDENTTKQLFLCCDFVTDSIVDDYLLPVLRRIPNNVSRKVDNEGNVVISNRINEDFGKMLWIGSSRSDVGEVRLYITDRSGRVPSFAKCRLNCTLICIPKWPNVGKAIS